MANIGLGTCLVHVDDSFADLHVAPAVAVTSSQFNFVRLPIVDLAPICLFSI